MFRKLTFVTTVMVAINLQSFSAGQGDGIPGIKPAVVQEKMDDATLVDKASFLIGYNMLQSIIGQGGKVDMAEMESGIKSSQNGEEQQSFIQGYNLAVRAKMQGQEVDTEKLMAGIKSANAGEDKKSFITGFQLMNNLQGQNAGLEIKKILEGMNAAVDGKESGISPEEARAVMMAFQRKMEEQQIAKMKQMSETNLAEGKAFLEKLKAENPNIKELKDGILYEVVREGTGASPTVEDRVRVNYHGTFMNGKVFDSTIKPPSGLPPEPAEFSIGGVVPGFSAALQAMKVGSRWKVYIPGPQAYGVQGKGEIGPNVTLTFEVEILDIVTR